MLNLGKGIKVSNMDGIQQGYQRSQIKGRWVYTINIGIETLDAMIEVFISNMEMPGFFFLEIPSNQNDDNNDNNYDVYYLDTTNKRVLEEIWQHYKTLLLNDGLCRFGFASHITKEEIAVHKYKVVYYYSQNLEKTQGFLSYFNIPLLDNFKTVWDNFTLDTPGSVMIVKTNNISIYDLPDLMKDQGLYLAGHTPE